MDFLEMKDCPHCKTRVLPTAAELCPSCRQSIANVPVVPIEITGNDSSQDEQQYTEEVAVNDLPQKKQHGLDSDVKCPKCGLTNPKGSLTCDCGYNFPVTYHCGKTFVTTKAYWEVQSEAGNVHTYFEKDEIIDAILKGDIMPDQECRQFGAVDQSGHRTETKWKRVSVSLVKSSFAVRVLFQPVWAHTIYGAGMGAVLGIIFWLVCGVILFIVNRNLAAGVVYVVFLCGWCHILLPERFQKTTEGLMGKVLLFALVAIGFWVYRVGLSETLEGVFLFGLSGQFGATVAGALAGVFPGMIMGTLVGMIRQNRLCHAPTAQPENRMGLMVKGLIIPLVLLVCVAVLYITFMPKLAEYVASNLK